MHRQEQAEGPATDVAPAAATPGRQSLDPGAAGDAPAASGLAVDSNRLQAAGYRLQSAFGDITSRVHDHFQPFKQAYDAYTATLARVAQDAETSRRVLIDLLLVGMGGFLGGMVTQFLRNRANAAPAAVAPTAAAPPAGAQLGNPQARLGGGAQLAPRPQPAAPARPALRPGDREPFVGAVTSGVDVSKNLLRLSQTLMISHGGASEAGPVEPTVWLSRAMSAIGAAQRDAFAALAELTTAVGQGARLEQDPSALVEQFVAQVGNIPEARPQSYYARELWTGWLAHWLDEARTGAEIDTVVGFDRTIRAQITQQLEGDSGPIDQAIATARDRVAQNPVNPVVAGPRLRRRSA
ncbi:MAG TPA: hypothetical protein VFQ53_33385 [Kofleriaceae bacterium]|nr:hypothetical protein [Kofleriaceae bacterium]